MISDNGPQLSSSEFQEFAKEYGFKHVTSSPHYPKANGEAERAIQTVKNLWRKNSDKDLALLDYRTTPRPGIELSPAQLLMGRRRLRNELPMMDSLLQPASVNQKDVSRYLKKTKEDQKKYHDRHAISEMKELQLGTKPAPAFAPSFQRVEASDGGQTSSHIKVLCSSSRRWQKVSPQQTAATNLPSFRIWKFKCRTVSSAHQNLPKDEPDLAAVPPVSLVIPPQEQQHGPEPTKADISEPYVPEALCHQSGWTS